MCLSLFVLANIMVMRCLMVMMGGSVVMSGGLMVMLASRMFCHSAFLLPGLQLILRPIARLISCGSVPVATPPPSQESDF
jgi:hypothetical protein